jgi:hypothetical protein
VKKWPAISWLFALSALHDGILGIGFLLAPAALFNWFRVGPPNHFGYVQFPAALLIVFGLMFLAIARDPAGKRLLIPYGALLKLSYSGIVLWYWIRTGLPGMWKPFAIIDLVFLVLFLWAWRVLEKAAQPTAG